MLSDRVLGIAFIVLGTLGAIVFAWTTVVFALTGGTGWIMVPVCALGVLVMAMVVSSGVTDLRAAGSVSPQTQEPQ